MEVHSDRGDGTVAPAAAPEREAGPPPGGTVYGGNGRKDTASLLRSIAADLSTLVTKQIELAKQELSEMIGARAAAVGVMAAAAILGLFVVGFLGLAGAEALALVLPRWAAMAIVAVVFVLFAVVAILVARSMLRSAAAKPELTQASLKEDVEWAKQQLRR